MSNSDNVQEMKVLDTPYHNGAPTMVQRIFSWRFTMTILLHTAFMARSIPIYLVPMSIVCMVDLEAPSTPSPSLSIPPSLRNPASLTNSSQTFAREINIAFNENSTRQPGHIGITNKTEMADFFNITTIQPSEDFPKRRSSQDYEFHWDSKTVGLILSAISMTSYISPVFAKFLSGYLGDKWTLSLTNFVYSLLIMVTPQLARASPYALVGLGLVQGVLAQGCIPVSGDCLAWWSPEKERLTAMSMAYTGFQTSGIVITSVAGFLCLIPVDNGWPFMFYAFGTLSLLWVLAWTILSADKPENHPFISEQEKMYIINNRMTNSVVKEQQRTPHLKIMTSLPVWGWLCISNVHLINCVTWAAYFPVYVSEVLRFNTTETGFVMSSTAVSRLVGSFLWAVLGNRLNEIPGMTTNKSRKICVLLGAACIDAELRWVAVALWCLIMLTQSMGATILPTIPLDMAPRYAGYLSGIAYSMGYTVSIAGPLVFAELTPTNSFEEWRTAWILMVGTYIVGGAAFLLCGQASPQDWAKNKEQKEMTNFLSQ